jgi:hypothetical protein
MVDKPGQVSKWGLRVVVYGAAVAGPALVVAALTAEDPPGWWLPVGIPLAVAGGGLASVWIFFRLRYPSAEQRDAYFERLDARRAEVGRPLDRSRLAHRATRHKKAVLRSGTDAAAVVVFLADGHRANEFKHLVYLELEVTRPGQEPYQVKTGEYLNAASAGSVSPGRQLRVKVDPADPQRVAVDWERSLRLT